MAIQLFDIKRTSGLPRRYAPRNDDLICVSLVFEVRINGDHFIYTKHDVVEIINIQPIGNNAKAYQVKQVRNLILKYKLAR